jgi:ADP-heptose:LPS heptosyltransferase
MKILVVQLLRLGDVVMATPVIDGLKRKFPKAQIHLLLNRSCEGLKPLLRDVDKFHFFDRDGLQSSLGDAEAPVFQALDQLETFVKKLNTERFDRVYNLTQNRLSGLLVSQIPAGFKAGWHHEASGQVEFSSPWFKYLNDHVAHGGREIFHYSDVFQYGAGLTPSNKGLILRETEAGRAEAKALLEEGERPICVQISTSDPQKEWSDEGWLETFRHLQIFEKNPSLRILGSPQEGERILNFTRKLQAAGLNARPALCGLEGAYSLLKQSRLVLSLDTSIKHMASAAGVPVIELCLGPSDERKTGVYCEDALILKPQAAGGLKNNSEIPALVIHHYLKLDWGGLRTIAKEYSKEVMLLRTGYAADFWAALPLDDTHRRWAFESLLNRSAWKLYLENTHKKLVGEYGSEGLRLKGTIPWVFPELDTKERMTEIRRIESEMTEVDERLRAISTTLKSFARRNSDDSRLAHLSEKIQDWVESNAGEVSSLQMLELSQRVKIGEIPDLKALRDLENHMRGYLDRQDIKLKLIRSIKTNTMETL